MASKKQLAVQNKMKQKVKEAKAIQKDNPNMKWTSCIKKAWKG